MKLLFAIKRLESASGGAERVLCTICSELADRGHEVSIVTFDRPGGNPFYPLDERVNRIDLGIGVSSRSAGIKETFGRIVALRHTIKKEKPDVAVGFMHSMFVPLALSMMGTKIPLIGSEHIVPEHYKRRPLQYVLLNIAAPLLSKITVLSDTIRKSYPYFIRRNMIVMPNPVLTTNQIVDHDYKKDRYLVLNVGRLDYQKDQNTLIRAFSRVSSLYPNWDMKIIGEGPLRRELETLIQSLHLESNINIAGVVSNIENEYCSADIFVMSSRYESFGLATAEAMSHALPVVGFSDCQGTNELISHSVTGLLADSHEGRLESLSKQLEILMKDRSLRKKIGIAGRESIGEKFSTSLICDKWELLLESECA